jgi:hypothetical protein
VIVGEVFRGDAGVPVRDVEEIDVYDVRLWYFPHARSCRGSRSKSGADPQP